MQQVAKEAAEADRESPGMLWMARSQRMVADEPQTLGALPRELVERLLGPHCPDVPRRPHGQSKRPGGATQAAKECPGCVDGAGTEYKDTFCQITRPFFPTSCKKILDDSGSVCLFFMCLMSFLQ